MNRINFNGCSNVEPGLFETQRKSARPGEKIDSYGSLLGQF